MTEKEFEKWVSLQNKGYHSRDLHRYQTENKITIVDFKHQKMACARCHPDDKFNWTTGTAIAYARLKGEKIPTVEKEPERWRADENEEYWFVTSTGIAHCYHEQTDITDDKLYSNCNYFKTKERTEKVAEKIKFLFKLEQYHDMYCPDYKPDWDNNNQPKHSVYFDLCDNKYKTDELYAYKTETDVYFPTEEIAQKVCDKLNEELNEK